MFQELFQKHIAKGILSRKMLSIDNGSIAIASDVGLTRQANQDRVAVMKFSSVDASYTLLSVVDGMGGMRDGEKSAEIAISVFFNTVINTIHLGPELAISKATLAANDAVFQFTNAKGGSTLTAILLSNNGDNFTVNVGDSRIYARKRESHKIVRLSIDDSLAEAVGGSGTELIQFIGMGDGIQPHISRLSSDVSQVFLTTDGIHYIEPATLSSIVENSDNVIQVVERLVATARWCGGPDNASICAADLENLTFNEYLTETNVVQVSDPTSTFNFILDKSNINSLSLDYVRARNIIEPHKNTSKHEDTDKPKVVRKEQSSLDDTKETSKERPKRKRARSKKQTETATPESKMQIKLTICDDESNENDEVKDDSSK
ncbi:protein phosphatase 2C domain-containing protein [Rheinheimera muenzenbergensis]|uniref:Protein phosphatase 2C domain-containing protein n=1 Tax=Rheinheimera muenzenbergensis TaxID=1193628 RepID=A0ABU8C114_9GAMM